MRTPRKFVNGYRAVTLRLCPCKTEVCVTLEVEGYWIGSTPVKVENVEQLARQVCRDLYGIGGYGAATFHAVWESVARWVSE